MSVGDWALGDAVLDIERHIREWDLMDREDHIEALARLQGVLFGAIKSTKVSDDVYHTMIEQRDEEWGV